MEILSVSLTNFKSHSDRYLEFQPGTNAISGENGAGKTSILEAIAWVLFDYSSDYNLSELIRNGGTSAKVQVDFVSSKDGQTYRVVRSTTKSSSKYEIFKTSPQLENLEKEKKEDVIPWLKEHLGVPKTTELPDLFVNTIGIPQGTFTVDFLLTPEPRKTVFDPILKVEDYKQAYKDSSKLKTYAEAQVKDLEQRLAQYEDRLQDWQELRQQHTDCLQSIQQDEAELQRLDRELANLQLERAQLRAQAEAIRQFQQQLEQLKTQIWQQHQTQITLQRDVEQARQAVETCKANRQSYTAYQQVELALGELSQERQHKATLEREHLRYVTTLNKIQVDLARLDAQLKGFETAQVNIEQLQPLIEQQAELEQQLKAIDLQLRKLEICETEQKKVQKQQLKTQAELDQLTQIIHRIQSLEPFVAQIPELEAQIRRYQEQLGRVGAAKQFEAELQQIVRQSQEKGDRHLTQVQAVLVTLQELQQTTPQIGSRLNSAIAAIQAGVDLNHETLNTLQQILTDLSDQVDEDQLQQRLQAVQSQLEVAVQHRLEFSTLPAKTEQHSHLQQEILQIQADFTQLQTQLAEKPTLEQQHQQLTVELQSLNNPRGQSRLLEQQLQQAPKIQTEHARISQQQAEIQQQIDHCDLQLAPFADLEARIADQEQLKQGHQSSYLLYLQNQKEANTLTLRQQQLEQALKQLSALEVQQTEQQSKYEHLMQNSDPQRSQQVEDTYSQTERSKYQLEGSLPSRRRDLARLDAELTKRQELATERDRTRHELKAKLRIYQFVQDARHIYDQAGPRITKLFTKKISDEADRIFRELLNRQSVALEWTEDYEIRMQEGGNWRSFKSLSGGEQMCAALAVRLALIRILADIDIVFLDEPTTNMDENRRKQLAQAVANVTNFRQLFVISHDDTFENVADNVILVERESAN